MFSFGGLKIISRCVVPFWKSVVGGELKVIQAQKRRENIHVCNEGVSSLPGILPLVFVQVVCLLLVGGRRNHYLIQNKMKHFKICFLLFC